MPKTTYALLTTATLFIMILLTRALPFLFARILKNSAPLQAIGNYLPAYIMLILVIYEVNITHFTYYPYGIPALIALATVVGLHYWKRYLLLSMFSGTSVYIICASLPFFQ